MGDMVAADLVDILLDIQANDHTGENIALEYVEAKAAAAPYFLVHNTGVVAHNYILEYCAYYNSAAVERAYNLAALDEK